MKQVLAIALLLTSAVSHAQEVDNRQILPLDELQRDHVLTEMRALLSGTQRILSALATEDMTAVAKHARSLGMGMAHQSENHLHSVLPKEFMQLGMSVHRSFDQLAADAESLKEVRHALQQLGESMKICSACHETYQIRVMSDSPMDSARSLHRHNH